MAITGRLAAELTVGLARPQIQHRSFGLGHALRSRVRRFAPADWILSSEGSKPVGISCGSWSSSTRSTSSTIQPGPESSLGGSATAASVAPAAALELYPARAVHVCDPAHSEGLMLPEEYERALADWWRAAGHSPQLKRILETEYDIPAFFLAHTRVRDQFKAFLEEDPDITREVLPALLTSPDALADAGLAHDVLLELARPFLCSVRTFVEAQYGRELATFRRARGLADLQNPQAWYPAARRLRRHWHLHLGPTNSGKTHAAVRRLLGARTGIYMGPLRLLAWEMFERMRIAGLRCALLTGQERLGPEDATHIACTVEAAPMGLAVEVAVLDEVQLVADRARGAAWTRALLGMQAKELHLCGADEPVGLPNILRRIALDCGDKVSEEARRNRLVPLVVEERPLGSLTEVLPGDCVICFTRHDVMLTKAELEKMGQPAALIYGSLPPQVRREQAALFNDPVSDRSVLVASDAVGMGLNLDIRRVVFLTLRKFDGEATRQLYPAEMRQIAGRAGRFGSRYGKMGFVTCLTQTDQEVVRDALVREMPGSSDAVYPVEVGIRSKAPQAAIFPSAAQLETFGRAMEAEAGRLLSFADLVERFISLSTVSPTYTVARADNVLAVARALSEVRLTPGEKLIFCQAPVAARESTAMMALFGFARSFAEDGQVLFPDISLSEQPAVVTPRYIFTLEELHKVCDVYNWLAQRFTEAFPDAQVADAARNRLANLLSEALRQPLEVRDEEDSENGRHSVWGEEGFLDDQFLD